MINFLFVYLVSYVCVNCIFLEMGEVLIDGMVFWWSVIYGYCYLVLNEVIVI